MMGLLPCFLSSKHFLYFFLISGLSNLLNVLQSKVSMCEIRKNSEVKTSHFRPERGDTSLNSHKSSMFLFASLLPVVSSFFGRSV